MTRLTVNEGPGAGERIELGPELLLGRQGDFGAQDDELSRRHALIRAGAGGLEIQDLGSLNGTFVNGRKIDRVTPLYGGDLVRVGRTVLEVEKASGADTVASAPAEAQSPREPMPAPSEPFGAYAAPEFPRARGRVVSRQLTPALLSFAAVIATAVALVVYFAQH